jgi:hypothetical protein
VDPLLEAKADLSEADRLLLIWERRSTLAAVAHSRSANRCGNWDTRLGALSVILTAIVGTSVFAALQKSFSTTAKVAVAFLTVGAAVTSAVHTFAGLAERKSSYEVASRRHAAVRRRIESARARLASGAAPNEVWREVEEIRSEMDTVAASNPNASGRIWDRTRRHLKGQFSHWERIVAHLRGLPPAPIGQTKDPDGPRERFPGDAGAPAPPSENGA